MKLEDYQSYIRAMAVKFGARDSELDDLVQEVNIRLLKGFSSFKGKSSIKTFIGALTRNTIYEKWRLGRKHVVAEHEPSEGVSFDTPLSALLQQEREAELIQVVDKLSTSDRDFLYALLKPDYDMRQHRKVLGLQDTGYRAKRWRVFGKVREMYAR